MVIKIEPSHIGTIDGDENVERGNWSRQLDFLLSCLGYAVGLGNVWRFPYLSYANGGGAFFIPFLMMLVLFGMPVFFMELSLGQYTSRGAVQAFKFCPLIQGVSYGMLLVSMTVCTYYGMIIAWANFYLVASFATDLPWRTCTNSWNTEYCADRTPDISREDCPGRTDNFGFCYAANSSERAGIWNTSAAEQSGFIRQLPASEFFKHRMLKQSSGIEELGVLNWELSLCLLVLWMTVYFSLFKGVKSSGKVVYFTALFPYAVLILLFIRGVTLQGAGEGIKYYITPQFHRLREPKVWRDAAGQVFFSLSVCWGGLIALSSYNRFNNNVLKDSIIVSLANLATSVFAGFVIYSFIGNLAYELKTSIENVSRDGTGLAFVIYPTAVLSLPGSSFWSIMFFVMLLTLGLDTQFALVETLTTTVFDMYPKLRAKKELVNLSACIILYIPGLTYCTNGGMYILKMVDSYASGWNVIILCLVEITSMSYIYGYERFAQDVKIMIGREPPFFWKICLKGLSQCVLVFVLFFDWIKYEGLTEGTYTYPYWANVIGWFLSIIIVVPVPVVMAINVYKSSGETLREKVMNCAKPSPEWGPALHKHRQLVTYVPGFVMKPFSREGLDDS